MIYLGFKSKQSRYGDKVIKMDMQTEESLISISSSLKRIGENIESLEVNNGLKESIDEVKQECFKINDTLLLLTAIQYVRLMEEMVDPNTIDREIEKGLRNFKNIPFPPL